MARKAVLVITDGIGYSPKHEFNAFYNANKPNYDKMFDELPYSMIKTYGLSVGLPEGQMGNSEVGHMTIGSGRILYQDLVKVTRALDDGSLKDNEALIEVLSKSNTLHLIGLMSDGGVHSHIDHFIGIAKIAAEKGKTVWLHLITDGRDVSPTSARKYLAEIEAVCNDNIKIATIGGRFYTMDRDNRWERIKLGYDAIVEAIPCSDETPELYVEASYKNDVTDEFLIPTAFSGYSGMSEGDSVVTVNFRSDRMREIVSALGAENFDGFERKNMSVTIATMTQYDHSFPYAVLFPKETPKHTLAETVSKAGLRQFHTAETEKYAHVTFFLNGGIDEPFENETRALVPSPKVKTYDMLPEMSADPVRENVLKAMEEGYDFVVVNFANGDMVGHTGVYDAALNAVERVDKELGHIREKAKELGYAFILTSDHGNCETMRDDNGEPMTQHTVGSVWCFVQDDRVQKLNDGGLNNIAPTVLKLMELDVPQEMDMPLF